MKPHAHFKGMKPFFILWFGQSFSSLGSSMTAFALILWVYQRQGTVTSISLLSLCTYLPSILFCFAAGTIADRWDKKKIMLASDFVAAAGTLSILLLYTAGLLEVWHLYAVNFAISCMSAFQCPASYVAVSLLVPREQYNRVGAMNEFSGALNSVATPALATAVMAFGGLQTVLIVDLATFAFAFLSLLIFIRLPEQEMEAREKQSFRKSLMGGLSFLWGNRPILKIILFFALINFFAYLTGFGILPALILARTGGNEAIMGMVSSAVGVGTLLGSVAATLAKPPKSRTRVIFLTCGLSFLLCNVPWAMSLSPVVWVAAAVAGNFPLPLLNANLTAIMRLNVPISMQGRVFSARDTIQFCTIPLGLALSGALADGVFEPLMAGTSGIRDAFALFVGGGHGSGLALMFFLTGVLGAAFSALALKSRGFKPLDGGGIGPEPM